MPGRVYATIGDMNLRDISHVLPILRVRLQPQESVSPLVDVLEGERPDARKSAVLLALFEQDGATHLVFIRRAATLRAHSGEIAFPGGSYDPEDTSLVATALREAFEVILLEPAPVLAHTEIWSNGGRIRQVYFYDYGSLRIWGATGRILNSLLTLLRDA